MKLGIVGLPNVGKSTLFNALTSTQNAQAANYPFCTIEPNSGIVPVPDARLDKLAEIWQTDKKTTAIVSSRNIVAGCGIRHLLFISFQIIQIDNAQFQCTNSQTGRVHSHPFSIRKETSDQVILSFLQ